MPETVLKLGGFTPLSTTDWPDRLAAVVFVQGCPWRCGYCHNPELQARAVIGGPQWGNVRQTLARRAGLLDGVVFSGGEPTLDPGLAGAIEEVGALGLRAALHTAGIYPDRLAALLPSLAWVGFDLKTDFAAYDELTASRRSGEAARAALDHLLASGVAHELRTTYHPWLISDASLLACARQLRSLGATQWVLQRWRRTDATSADLAGAWHWPDAGLLNALRAELPSVVLR